jgi:hypothetical protein
MANSWVVPGNPVLLNHFEFLGLIRADAEVDEVFKRENWFSPILWHKTCQSRHRHTVQIWRWTRCRSVCINMGVDPKEFSIWVNVFKASYWADSLGVITSKHYWKEVVAKCSFGTLLQAHWRIQYVVPILTTRSIPLNDIFIISSVWLGVANCHHFNGDPLIFFEQL